MTKGGERFEDTKGVTRSRKSKDRHHNDQAKKTIGQTIIYKTLKKTQRSNKTYPTKSRG